MEVLRRCAPMRFLWPLLQATAAVRCAQQIRALCLYHSSIAGADPHSHADKSHYRYQRWKDPRHPMTDKEMRGESKQKQYGNSRA
jgi:hypothetical protein